MVEDIWNNLDNKIKAETNSAQIVQKQELKSPVQVSSQKKVVPVTQPVMDNAIYAKKEDNKILFSVLNYFLDIIKISLGILLAFLIIFFIIKSQVDFSKLAEDLAQKVVDVYNSR